MKKTELAPLIDRRLSGIRFEREEAVIQGLRREGARTPARRFRLVPALALILALLLAGTALALGLSLSARMNARQLAVEALGQSFGLSEETIGLFEVNIKKDGADWLVRLTPKNTYPAEVGEYEVSIRNNAVADTRWSLEGSAEYNSDKGLASPVWGQEQLLAYKQAVQNYYDKMSRVDWSKSEQWDLQERARVDQMTRSDQPLVDEILAGDAHAVPGQDDLQPEEAWDRAARALAARYGLPLEYISGMARGYQSFMESREDKSRWYAMTFEAAGKNDGEAGQESFYILLSSPQGEVLKAAWFQPDDSKRALPAGSLIGLRDAVEEYMNTQAFPRLTAARKADAAQRMTAAGFGDLLDGAVYLTPGPGQAAEAAALQKARAVLQDAFQVKGESLSMFVQDFSLQEVDGAALWVLRLTPEHEYQTFIGPTSLIGDYEIRLNEAADEAVLTRWSFSGVDEGTYTRSDWGRAKAYAGYILPWLKELKDKADAVKAAAQDEYFLTVAEAAQHDQLFRDAGFSVERYGAGTPRKDDISEDKAISLALETLRVTYGREAVDKEPFELIWPSYLLRAGAQPFETEQPFWMLSFHGGSGIYVVALDAKSGQILYMNYDPAASGNG